MGSTSVAQPTEEDFAATGLYRGATRVEYDAALIEERDAAIKGVLASTADPASALADWERAKALSSFYGRPAEQILANMDFYASDYFGEKAMFKTAPQAIWDAGRAAANAMQIGKIFARLNGWSIAAATGFDDITPKERSSLLARVEALESENKLLQVDPTPRPWLVEASKWLASAIPYTAEAVGRSLVVGAAAVATAKSLGLSSAALVGSIKAWTITMLGFYKGYQIMSGMEYRDMINNGVPDEVAKTWAQMYGVVAAATEQFLGIDAMVAGSVSGKAVTAIAEKIVTKLGVSGVMASAAAKAGVRVLLGQISETGEEDLQELESGLVQFAVQSIVDEGVIKNPLTVRRWAQNIAQTTIQTLVTAPFLGIAGNISMTLSDVKLAKDMARIAPSLDRESFVDAATASGAFAGPGVGKESQADLAGQVWDKQAKKRMDQAAAGAQKAKVAASSGQEADGVERKDDGSLFVVPEHIAGRGQKGEAKTRYTAGPASGGQEYGFIETEEGADTVTLSRSDIEGKYLGVTSDIIENIAVRNPGKAIVLSPDADEALQGGYERYIEKIGGQEANQSRTAEKISPADSIAMDRVKREITAIVPQTDKDAGRGEAVATVATKLMQLQAKSLGVSFSEYSANLGFDKLPGAKAKTGRGTTVAGNISFKGASKAGAVAFTSAIIKLASDTVSKPQLARASVHELTHYYRAFKWRSGYDANMEAVEKAYGIEKGQAWTAEHEERFAEDFESWVRDKKSVAPEKATFFERMAEFFRSVFKYVGTIPEANPVVVKAFDEWFAGPDMEQDLADIEAFSTLASEGKAAVNRHVILEKPEPPTALNSEVSDENVEYDKVRRERFKIEAADESWATPELLNYIKHLETALKTHNLTRIHNLFAYENDIVNNNGLPYPVQVSMDADTLKFVNDTLGHEQGDRLLVKIADALFESSLSTDMRVYHKSGDEFIAQGNDRDVIEKVIRDAIEKVSKETLSGKVANHPGFVYTLTGIGISAGFDSEGDLEKADMLMQKDKEAREASGKRTRRGDFPAGLSIFEESGGRRLSERESRMLLGLSERRVQSVQGSLEEGTGEDAGLLGIYTLTSEERDTPGPDETREHTQYERTVESQARAYKDLDSWLADIFGDDWETLLSEDDVKWYGQRFEWAKSDRSLKRAYRKPGDFQRFLASGDNLSTFIKKIAGIVYSKRRYQNDDTARHAERIEGAIARTPEIKDLVDAYNASKTLPSPEQAKALLGLVKKYEGLYKYLFAMVEADQDLANEALDDLNMIPELVKRDVTGNPSRSLSDNQDLIDSIENAELVEKIQNKTVTVEDIEKLLSEQEAKWKAAVEAATASEGYTPSQGENERNTKARIREAVETAKKNERSYYRAKERARKYLEAVRRTEDFILRRPSARVDLNYAMIIRLIQEYAQADKPVDIRELRAAGSFVFAKNDRHFERIVKVVDGISGKPMGAWTLAQLETLAAVVEDLTIAGRNALRNEELFFGEEVRANRNAILDELRSNKYWAKMGPQFAFASEDDKDNQKRLAKMSVLFDADRPDAFFRKYLGKEATAVLFDALVSANNAKMENYDRRTKPVLDFLASSGLAKQRRLFQQLVIPGVGPEGTDLRITKSELIGVRLLVGTRNDFNSDQREAFIYGNLFSGDEKNVDGGLTEENQINTNMMMKKAYEQKLETLLAAIETMSPDEESLARLMMATTDNDRDWYRFASTIYRLTNTEPKKEKYYFPIMRVGDFSDGEDATNDALKGLDMTWAIPKGMSIERRNMQPRNHKEIQYDAMKVFFGAIQKQEHLTEMGMYVKTLRGIFKSSTMSETLRKGIVNALGKKAWDFIDNQIATITNPAEFIGPASGAEALNLFRGSMVVSNLAWRASSVLMQIVTSPLPFLSEAPAQLYAVAAEAMVKNPFKFYKEIEEKSAYLRNRQIDPTMAKLEQRTEQGVATAFEKIGRAGMIGLTMADRISVAIGWEAVRRKQRGLGMSEDDAREYADRVVIKTQPTSEDIYRAPMYRNMTPFKQLVLQFTQPLNVIWNNLRNDIPAAAQDHEYGKIVGFITAYALSGLAIGAIACVRGNGPDEPDEEKWMRFWLHAMTAQFTDSIPLVGNIVTGLTGTLIVGDNNSWTRNDTNMPAVDLLARAVEGFASDNKNWGKIVTNTAMGMGMMVGAPTRAVKEMADLIGKGVGAIE